MKMSRSLLILSLLHGCEGAAFRGMVRQQSSMVSEAKLGFLVDEMIESAQPATAAVMKQAESMSLDSAMERLEGRLPEEVSSMVRMMSNGEDAPVLTEES